MKIPCCIDLQYHKSVAQEIINTYGHSRDVNQLASVVHCKDDNGTSFDLVQFHNNRRYMHVMGV